jgi:hypothetical protein
MGKSITGLYNFAWFGNGRRVGAMVLSQIFLKPLSVVVLSLNEPLYTVFNEIFATEPLWLVMIEGITEHLRIIFQILDKSRVLARFFLICLDHPPLKATY